MATINKYWTNPFDPFISRCANWPYKYRDCPLVAGDILEVEQDTLTDGVYVKVRVDNDKLSHIFKRLTQGLPKIKNVKFSDPATIIFWEDGTKTIVKASNEEFDPEKGLAMAIAKKALGNKGNYFNEFRKWLPKEAVTEEIKNEN